MAKGNPPAGRQKFFFQFVTTPTADTPGTTLLLHFDNRRYFFGQIAEGTQRACIQRGVGIKKVRNIFLTGQTLWQNMGGLVGMILTMADVQSEEREESTGKRPKLNIYGGPKLWHAMACARRFVFRTNMPLAIHEAQTDGRRPISEPQYSDENINVWSLSIRRGRSGVHSPVPVNGRSTSPDTITREQALREKTVTDMFDSDWRKDRLVEARFADVKLPAVIWTRDPTTKELHQNRCVTMEDAPHLSPDSKVLVRNPWPAALVGELPPADNIASSISTSYIVRSHPQRGNFLPQKAKELGVKPGPAYSKLTAGESVTLEDGKIITSEMVMNAPEPGKGMAIFDIPTAGYLEDLSDKIEELKSNEIMVGIEMMSWLLGPGVVYSPEYRQMIESLPNVQHFISSPDTCANYLAIDSSAASSLRLSQIRPECFGEPIHNNNVPSPPTGSGLVADLNYTPAERGMIAQGTPKLAIRRDEVPELLDVSEIKKSHHDVLADFVPAPLANDISTPYDDIEFITLGTGSAVPSKYRNVSGTLLRIPGLGSYLIDCGENTLGQLRRIYTPDELDDVLCDMRMLWVSHLHADHHLGTLSVIVARNEALSRRAITDSDLYIVSEPNMADYLIDYSSVQGSNNCVLLACLNSNLTLNRAPYSIAQTSLPIKELATTRVSHCHNAQAISVTFSNGFKFSYSGDCRPSASFATIGADSHVLLHEATFDDGMEGDAKAKRHSTTGEALGVAVQMRAKHVILTHFSQRYQKIPVLNNIKFADDAQLEEEDLEEGPVDDTMTQTLEETNAQAQSTANSSSPLADVSADLPADLHICVAFDLMRVKVQQIRDMHCYYPAIERMFEQQQQLSEAKRAEAAAIYEQQQADNKNKNKGKPNNEIGDSIPKRQNAGINGNIYERINRGKGAKSHSTQKSLDSESLSMESQAQIDNLAQPATTQVDGHAQKTESQKQSTDKSDSQSEPYISKRARKRMQIQAEKAATRRAAKEASARDRNEVSTTDPKSDVESRQKVEIDIDSDNHVDEHRVKRIKTQDS